MHFTTVTAQNLRGDSLRKVIPTLAEQLNQVSMVVKPEQEEGSLGGHSLPASPTFCLSHGFPRREDHRRTGKRESWVLELEAWTRHCLCGVGAEGTPGHTQRF